MIKKLIISLLSILILVDCSSTTTTQTSEKPKDAPDTWIADRTIKGLVFQSAGDASVDMNPEVLAYIKERTGITFELEGITSEDSTSALAAGLAAGDLPDFVAFYLDNSGRPEMQILLKASNEGQFADVKPFLENSKYYSKYLEEGYLPQDTYKNIMFRKEWDGASYLVHMSINREPGMIGRKAVGGPYIRKDIVEALGIDPLTITTSEQLLEVAKKIKEGNFKDKNGADISIIGPTAWGGSDRDYIYNDLVFSGNSGEKFLKTDGSIKHESQTDVALKRVEFVRNLMKDGLMHPEFYTMEENRAKEGIINGSFAIVSDMHNFMPENADMQYIPLGPINRFDGTNNKILQYKSGYAGWAIPATTKNPEEVVKFADWLISPEGKMLYFYGLEGRDYTLGTDGKPVPNEDLIKLKKDNPDEAKKRGFRGVGAYWGEHLGYTDMDNVSDFGERTWGEKLQGTTLSVPLQIAEMYKFDEKVKNATIIDGMTPRSYLFEFEGDDGKLAVALDRWNDDLLRAYYAKSNEEAKKILEESANILKEANIEEFDKFLQDKEAQGDTIRY